MPNESEKARTTAKKSAVRKPAALKPAAKKTAARKSTEKRTAAKKPTARKKGSGRGKVLKRFEQEGPRVVALYEELGDFGKVGEKLGMSARKCRRLYALTTLKPSDRIAGTDAEVGKAIVRLRDEEGAPWAPDFWARTGLGIARMRKLYEEASGKSWKDSGKTTE